MPVTKCQKYKIKPTSDTLKTFDYHLDGVRYIKNRCTGDRLAYIEWQRSFVVECLPVGVFESAFRRHTKTIKELEKVKRDIVSTQNKIDSLHGKGFQDKKLNDKDTKELKDLVTKLPLLHDSLVTKQKALDKLKNKDVYEGVIPLNTGEELKCDISCTLSLADLDSRDYSVVSWVKGKNHVDVYTQQIMFAANSPNSLVKTPFDTFSGRRMDLSGMCSSAVQQACQDVDKGFDRWLNPDSKGNRSGKPRFKKSKDTKSFTVKNAKNQKGNASIEVVNAQVNKKGKNDNEKCKNKYAELKVPGKVSKDNIRVIYHRPLPDNYDIKRVQFVKEADGWYVSITFSIPDTDKEDTPEANLDNTVGFDAVLQGDIYLAGSNNKKYKSVKLYRQNQKELARLERLEDCLKNTGVKTEIKKDVFVTRYTPKVFHKLRRVRQRIKLLHQRIARQRKIFQYLLAHEICRTPGLFHIVLEDLKIKNLVQHIKAKYSTKDARYLPNGQSSKSGLAKSFHDAAFYQFGVILTQVAAKYGISVHKVPPQYSSRILSYNDETVFSSCAIREYWDELNSIMVDRDCNAGSNLVRRLLGLFPTKDKKGKVSNKKWTIELSKHFLKLASKRVDIIGIGC